MDAEIHEGKQFHCPKFDRLETYVERLCNDAAAVKTSAELVRYDFIRLDAESSLKDAAKHRIATEFDYLEAGVRDLKNHLDHLYNAVDHISAELEEAEGECNDFA